jgi:hypothetical protein
MRLFLPKPVWGLMLLLSVRGLEADPLSQWTWQFPYPQGNTLRAVTYGGGQFVAVGDNGTIITSPDGYIWASQTYGVFPNLKGVAYAGGQYAAVGDEGIILVSSNATTWTQMPALTTNTLRGVAGDSGSQTDNLPQFLAVGDSGTAVGCSGGTNWSPVSTGTSNALYGVTLNSSFFMAVGNAGTVIKITASDFSVIPPSTVGTTNNLYAISSPGNAGAIVVTGDLTDPSPLSDATTFTNEILFSPDQGTTWGAEKWPPNPGYFWPPDSGLFVLTGAAYGPEGFVAVGSDAYDYNYDPAVIMISPTVTNWTELPVLTSENPLGAVTWGNGLYVAVGDSGSIVVSTNATNWTEIIPDRRSAILAIACNTNLSIATAVPANATWGFPDFASLVSSNGGNWEVSHTTNGEFATEPPPVGELPTISDLACGGSQFVGISGASVFTTADGYNWQQHGPFRNFLSGVRYANGAFFAVGGNGTIYSSIDGTNWVNHSLATTGSFNGMAYGNGLYVAAGTVGATSTDGINWVLGPTNPPETVYRLVYGDGLFVAASYTANPSLQPGEILTSPDGVNWTIRFTEPGGQNFSGIACTGGVFLAISGGDPAATFKSTDGVNWQATGFSMPVGLSYYVGILPGYATVCARNGTFLVGGKDGRLFQSGNVWTPATLGPSSIGANRFNFSYNQQIDVPYHIQASSNLADWTNVYAGIGIGQPTNFLFPVSSNDPGRFFRIVSP